MVFVEVSCGKYCYRTALNGQDNSLPSSLDCSSSLNVIEMAKRYKSLQGCRTSTYISLNKNGIQLISLNIVSVRVVLSAFNMMRATLFCICKTLSSNFLLQDDQIGLRYNMTGSITARQKINLCLCLR